MIKKYLSTQVVNSQLDWVSLILRIVGGGFMLTHGVRKFSKLVGGDSAFGDPIGLGPEFSLYLVVFAEFICAILVLIGLGTRLAVIPLMITMLVAGLIVHGSDPFADKEMAYMYLAIYTALFILGSGKYSLDKLLFNK